MHIATDANSVATGDVSSLITGVAGKQVIHGILKLCAVLILGTAMAGSSVPVVTPAGRIVAVVAQALLAGGSEVASDIGASALSAAIARAINVATGIGHGLAPLVAPLLLLGIFIWLWRLPSAE